MGLFNKKKKDEAEDFILDFGGDSTVNSENADGELNITLWDDRKPHRPSHAMTVSEILGNFEETEASESANAEMIAPKFEPAPSPETAEETAEVVAETISEKTVFSEEIKEYDKGEKISVPRNSAPSFSSEGDHVETDTVIKDISAPPEIKIAVNGDKSAEERAAELVNRLKKENETLSQGEETASSTPTDTVIAEAPAPIENHPADTEPKAEVSQASDMVAKQEPALRKKETKLSPAAQALYDRMMAERARNLSANLKAASSDLTPAAPEVNLPSEAPEISLDFKDEDITLTSDIAAEPSAKSETIADAIFDSLNESFKTDNPLSRKKEQSADSLLSKCKSYVNPAYDIETNPKSIDDIIHSAEQGARERLSNLYDIHDSEQISVTHHTHEFSPFIQKTTPGIDGKPISVPVKIQDETTDGAIIASTTGNISDFQCSFADNSDSPVDGATRIIDIKSSSSVPHVTDPVKAQVIRDLLKPLAEEEEEPVSVPLRFSATEEAELPDSETAGAHQQTPEVEDYNSFEDAESVRTDLSAQQLSIVARLIPTAVITLILLVIDTVLKDAIISASLPAFALLNIVLFGVALAVNHRTLKGLTSLFGGVPDIDSPTALGVTSVFLYTVITAISGSLTEAPLLVPAAMLILSFNLLGKLSIIKRIRRGFEVIANDSEKKALCFVEDKYSASVMAGGGVIGDALISFGKKTNNVRDYLKNAFDEDAYERKLSPVLLLTVISGAAAALIAFFVNDGVIPALAAFALVACTGCPLAAIFSCNLPLALVSKKLASYGAMLAGHSSAESIANANAVAFDAADLFPRGTIKLYNMQVIEQGAVDKYIASASAILSAAGSPLAPIFEEILETNNEKIPVADSIKYENNMGVSGWIDDRRIFVGNRTLMEGHSIKTPNLELDKKILRQGYFPLYLACDQQLCALFVVGYEADEEITYELRNLCNTGVTMLVNSNDPNVSEEMLCDYFGLYPDSIKVMNATGVAAYKTAGAHTESVSAPASYSQNICGFLSAVTSSIRMKSIITTLLIIQFALIVLGIALTGYSIFTTGIMGLPLLGVLGFQLAGAVVTYLAAHLRQP